MFFDRDGEKVAHSSTIYVLFATSIQTRWLETSWTRKTVDYAEVFQTVCLSPRFTAHRLWRATTIFPCLLAGDRYKIAVETLVVARRDLIANECGGVTVSLHRRLIQFTRRRYHGALVSRESAQTSLPRLNIFNYKTLLLLGINIHSLFYSVLHCSAFSFLPRDSKLFGEFTPRLLSGRIVFRVTKCTPEFGAQRVTFNRRYIPGKCRAGSRGATPLYLSSDARVR